MDNCVSRVEMHALQCPAYRLLVLCALSCQALALANPVLEVVKNSSLY
jgi:hypothetical protein